MPGRPPELPHPIRYAQLSTSDTPPIQLVLLKQAKKLNIRQKYMKFIKESTLIAHSENSKEKDTRTDTIYQNYFYVFSSTSI